jgi:hypothetical protein
VTGKPATNPAVVVLDTSSFVAHRRHTVEIPPWPRIGYTKPQTYSKYNNRGWIGWGVKAAMTLGTHNRLRLVTGFSATESPVGL